jgi:small-conductance mechanosensitive channel
MKRVSKNLLTVVIAGLLIACVLAAYLTRDAGRAASKQPAPNTASPIDERLEQTARQMAGIADVPDEQDLAREALRLSDHEFDQAFASALRVASALPAPARGPLKVLTDQIEVRKERIASEKDQIAKLSKTTESSESAAARLELTKAQLALDEDELADAQEDLARAGGDQHAQLQRAFQEHEAAQHGNGQQLQFPAPQRTGTLGEQIAAWFSLGRRQSQLEAARKQAADKASLLGREHQALERVNTNKTSTDAGASGDPDEEEMNAMVTRLRLLSDRSKTLAELDRRGQDSQQLASVYARWMGLVETRRRAVLHLCLIGLASVLAILFAVVVIDRSIRRSFAHRNDRRLLHQLQIAATIAVQLIGAGLILVIVFGLPTQTSTMIGLATAGLTVVLRDFIVAFFGWFTLMGEHGMRVGDWVEIEGVGGEVIEIGLMKTVLLEMGNRADTAHPTGRRVAFVNKFAIEGHYFNFSTTGQWLWDELQMTLPATGDAYQMALLIRQKVELETEADAREAENDWQKVKSRSGVREFSAKPLVDLRPSGNGLDVIVRYVTRAPERYTVKSKLFQAIVDLIHKRPALNAGGQV